MNDLDERLVTFYRVVQHHPQALLDELTWLPRSRATFEELLAQPGVTDIQRAARWFAANKLSFASKGEHFGTSFVRPGASRERWHAGIFDLHERLDRVYIERLDWRELLPRYDRPGALFYVDPPYTAGHQYDVGAWGEEDHVALRDALFALEGAWVLSYDDSELVRDLYGEGCTIRSMTRSTSMANRSKTGVRFGEVVITPRKVDAMLPAG